MPKSLQPNLPPMEVKPLHGESSSRVDAVKNLPHAAISLAKAAMGAAIRLAIGDAPYKTYGHEGLLSAVCSGEKVPEYLGRIYQDRSARRRLAFALLRDDAAVRCRTTIEWDEQAG